MNYYVSANNYIIILLKLHGWHTHMIFVTKKNVEVLSL